MSAQLPHFEPVTQLVSKVVTIQTPMSPRSVAQASGKDQEQLSAALFTKLRLRRYQLKATVLPVAAFSFASRFS